MEGGFFYDFKEMLKELFVKELSEYENLGLTSNVLARLRLGVIAFFIAIIVAAFVVSVNRNMYGLLVTRINAEHALCPDDAKTLKELGCDRRPAIRDGIRRKKYFGLVHCVEEDEYNEAMQKKREEFEEENREQKRKKTKFTEVSYRFNFETNRFYIPEEKSYSAESRFERKGTGVLALILITIFSLAAMFVTLYFLPDVFQLINNFIGIINS